MKTCPFCKEEIKEDAVKCRFCSSMLDESGSIGNDDRHKDRIVYILDRDLIRFTKFAGALLALFVVCGAFFYGFDLKEAAKEIRSVQEEARKTKQDIQQATETLTGMRNQAAAMLSEAKTHAAAISQSDVQVKGIVAGIVSATSSIGQQDVSMNSNNLVQALSGVLTSQQLAVLKSNINSTSGKMTPLQVLRLLKIDAHFGTEYFRANGFKAEDIAVKISPLGNYENAYWDPASKAVVFGMGMVNSDTFGPYDSGLIFHEMTHSLFSISFQGQSGSVSESICDVIAIAMRNNGQWTIGKVKGPNGQQQALRSLENPGKAYDTPVLGKDSQPRDMADFVRTEQDSDGVHSNNGILNRAAYLMSEGGQQRITIHRGIGVTNLGRLYMETIRQLPRDASVDFNLFKTIVIRAAEHLFGAGSTEVRTVGDAFTAVGI